MKKTANILDWPKPGLDPNIWNEGSILKPEVKKFITDFIHSFAQANNFKDTSAWITDVKFVGSLTTNCWNSNSDMDIHVVVDIPKFVAIEHPEMSDKEASDYLDEIRKQVDQVKAKVTGTNHPTEVYFESEFTTHASQEFSGAYSVLQDKWLTEPHIVGQDFDFSTLHPDLLNLAKETTSELDAAFGEIKRDVQDIKDLQDTINDWPPEQRELFENKLQKRLNELETEIKELVDLREDVAEKRKKYKALSEQEVRFKYLQKYFYMHVLTDLKTLLKQSPELTVKDIPVVENIMSQASLAEGRAAWIDPEGNSYPVNVTHSTWVMQQKPSWYKKWGIDTDALSKGINFEDEDSTVEFGSKLLKELIKHGWSRVWGDVSHGSFYGAEIKDIKHVPEAVFDFIAGEPQNYRFTIEDLNRNYVELTGEELAQGQKAVNKSLQQNRMSTASRHEDSAEGRICIDFDQTIAEDNDNGTIGQPEPNAKTALEKLKADGWYIIIFSHRSTTEYGEDQIKEFLDKHDIPYDEIYTEKPNAEFFVDDRAITFTTWEDVLKKVKTTHLPEKEAILYKKTDLDHAYWIDPNGKTFEVRGSDFGDTYSGKDTHDGWVRNNLLMLKHDYGIEPRKDQWGSHLDSRDLIDEGWVRVGDSHNKDWGISVKSLDNIPSHVDNLIAQFAHTGAKIEIDDVKNNYQEIEWPVKSIQQAVNQALKQPVTAALNLPTIDPKTLNRKEPYALFIGTQRFPPDIALDLFDVFGQHPMITESNRLPTVTLDTLIKENIPVIGKAPRAGDKQPAQDLSKVVKTAQLGSEYDFSSTHFLLPKELAEKIIRWAIESIPEDQIVHDSKDPGTKGVQLESHITLKYGLLTDDFEEVKNALDGEKAPHIKFVKTSFFEPEGKDYDVVIIPVESEDLQALNEKLCSQVKHEDLQFKEYHPHVTVAYVKKGLGKTYDGKDILDGEELDLNELTFSPKVGDKQRLELHKKASNGVINIGSINLDGKKFPVSVPQDLLDQYFAIAIDMRKALEDPKLTNKDLLKNKYWDKLDRSRADLHNKLCEFAFKQIAPDKNYNDFPMVSGDIKYEISKFVEDMIPREDLKTEKESSFMPSNTDLAPSDDWAGTVGYPTNESMDAPQNKSDEETWYSPENDRPRSKNFLKRMLSLFQKPLSKKEPKEIVPVKEASNKTASRDHYWVSPEGEFFDTSYHGDWIWQNWKLLKQKGFTIPNDVKKFTEKDEENVELPAGVNSLWEQMIGKGWIRIGDGSAWDTPFAIELNSFRNIPSYIQNFILERNPKQVEFEDKSNNLVTIKNPASKDLHKAVNEALRSPTKTATVKEADSKEPIIEVGDFEGRKLYVQQDLMDRYIHLANLISQSQDRDRILYWDAEMGDLHPVMTDFAMEHANLPDNYDIRVEVRAIIHNFAERNLPQEKMSNYKQAKQWVTPKEPVNKPGMDWGWADYIYNYVDENWQDLLHDWLELDSKNYVKPIVLIEQIYEDEGKVSAWVHIEFVNTNGSTDAFMKLIITSDIHYEPSYEPEGVETHEWLDNWEIDVKDYGKSDELEKTSGYGPTNYKGPSTPDVPYQDSAWGFDVTYSPEEMAENESQNGAGGYPNRFFVPNKSRYYSYSPEFQMLKTLKCPYCNSNDVEEDHAS